MKKEYIKPVMESELFVANEYVAACFAVILDNIDCQSHVGCEVEQFTKGEVLAEFTGGAEGAFETSTAITGVIKSYLGKYGADPTETSVTISSASADRRVDVASGKGPSDFFMEHESVYVTTIAGEIGTPTHS